MKKTRYFIFASGLVLSLFSQMAIAQDLNGDGRIDIVVGNVEAPSTIYFNDSSAPRSVLIGHYTPVHFGDNKGTVYGFAIADLDRDGLPDIAVARSDAPNAVYFASPGPAGKP